jgi:GTP diphosphokinase / guanosine-3',5'-bis(diphosphate) 3'-diphosphatase
MNYSEYLLLREKAFALLWSSTEGKIRWSSPVPEQQPYWTHPLHVYLGLVQEGITHYEALIAAILHDIIEDTSVTLLEIGHIFGKEVQDIVDLVSKSDKFNDSNPGEFYNRIIDSNNTWAMYIKVFDRVDNLITYAAYSNNVEEVRRFIDESKEFFTPIAKIIRLEKKLSTAIEYAEKYYNEINK